jgi:superfamily I DNA and/or RNA helicase
MCQQAVLIGDQKQLPATVLSKLAQREGLGLSLFERMVDAGVAPTLLQEQRRMHSSIAEFPNQTFYSGQLINAVDDDSFAQVPGFPWPTEDCRVCFVDVANQNAEGKVGFSTFNTAEAEAVAGVLRNMLEAGVQPHEIGILTAYLAQKQELMRAIRDMGMSHVFPSVTVDTVDGYQGMERDIVLFSATRSNDQSIIGFLSDARRMNVMLTRARRGLVVFGNSNTLRYNQSMDSQWRSWLDWVESRGSSISHSESAESKWPLPSAASSAAAIAEDARSGAGASIGDIPPPPPVQQQPSSDWTKVYSEQYSAHYYWNRATGQTQWEVPPGYDTMSACE